MPGDFRYVRQSMLSFGRQDTGRGDMFGIPAFGIPANEMDRELPQAPRDPDCNRA